MALDPFDLGDVAPLTINTFDAEGTLANAAAVSLTIGLPDGTITSLSPTNPSTGRYEYDYATVQSGLHTVRWVATGANQSAYPESFYVRSANPGYIVSLARAKAKLRIELDDASHDEDLRDYIEASTEIIEDHLKLTIPRRTVVDEFQLSGCSRALLLNHTPAVSITSVQTVDGLVTWDPNDLHLNGESGVLTVVRGALFRGHVQVIYPAGMALVKAKYRRAALIIIEHLWQTERAESVAGPFPGAYEDTADGMRFARGAGFAIPNRALELLGKPAPMIVG